MLNLRSVGLTTLSCVALFATPVSAAPVVFWTSLTGAAEAPPNASPATGWAKVIMDLAAHTMSIDISFADLLGPTTAAHIHCCTAVAGAGTAGVATQVPNFAGFPVGVTSGSYSNVFDMTLSTSFNPTFVTTSGGTVAAAEQRLFDNMVAGKTYVNVHSSAFPGGEIRGFLVDEPAALALLGVALVSLALQRSAAARSPARRR